MTSPGDLEKGEEKKMGKERESQSNKSMEIRQFEGKKDMKTKGQMLTETR